MNPTIRNREVAHPWCRSSASVPAERPRRRAAHEEEDRMTTEATVVFVIVVGLRFLLPLFIPRWPLPFRPCCWPWPSRRSCS